MSEIKFTKEYYTLYILPLLKQGLSTTEITNIVSCSRPIVSKLIKTYSTTEDIVNLKKINFSKKSHFKVTESVKSEILKLSESGYGIESIAKRLSIKIHPTTVMMTLRRTLSKDEYKKRHDKSKFDMYWSGRYFKNDRGDLLQSSLEEKVVDFLFQMNVIYYTCKYVLCLNGKNKMYCDVYIPKQSKIKQDLYIEIFGLSDLDFYKIKMFKKIKEYENLNLELLPLYRNDFDSKNSYSSKLTEFLNKNHEQN